MDGATASRKAVRAAFVSSAARLLRCRSDRRPEPDWPGPQARATSPDNLSRQPGPALRNEPGGVWRARLSRMADSSGVLPGRVERGTSVIGSQKAEQPSRIRDTEVVLGWSSAEDGAQFGRIRRQPTRRAQEYELWGQAASSAAFGCQRLGRDGSSGKRRQA